VQAVQRITVNCRARQNRVIGMFEHDGQALKPVYPLRNKMVFALKLINYPLPWR
jgi:hypothetical protein